MVFRGAARQTRLYQIVMATPSHIDLHASIPLHSDQFYMVKAREMLKESA